MAVVVVRGRLTDPRVRSSLLRLLRENVLASFATVNTRGHAHISTAYFAWDRAWNLYFYSYPESQHSRNLTRQSSMAVAIFDTRQRWGSPDCGVQLFGRCAPVIGARDKLAARTYSARFPDFATWVDEMTRGEGRFPLVPYRFAPRSGKLFDERALGSGRFIEFPFP
jgi:uncharacterized protein YhbP (UPF0306 family)